MVFLFTAPQKLDRARVAGREMNNVASAQTESESPCLIFFSCCRGARPKGLILKTVCVTEWQSVRAHTHIHTPLGVSAILQFTALTFKFSSLENKKITQFLLKQFAKKDPN